MPPPNAHNNPPSFLRSRRRRKRVCLLVSRFPARALANNRQSLPLPFRLLLLPRFPQGQGRYAVAVGRGDIAHCTTAKEVLRIHPGNEGRCERGMRSRTLCLPIYLISFCASGIAISGNEIEAYVSGLCLHHPSPPLLQLRLRRRPPRLHYNDKWAARAIISLGQISCQISHFRRTRLLSLYLGRKGKAGERRTGEGVEKQLFLGPFTHFRQRAARPTLRGRPTGRARAERRRRVGNSRANQGSSLTGGAGARTESRPSFWNGGYLPCNNGRGWRTNQLTRHYIGRYLPIARVRAGGSTCHPSPADGPRALAAIKLQYAEATEN